MLQPRRSSLAFVSIVLLGLLAVPPSLALASAEEAGKFLVSLNMAALETLNDTKIGEDQRQDRFRKMARDSFDIPRISKFVLGINWRRATPKQRDEFLDVFEEVNLQRFMPLFAQYADQKFTVDKARQDQQKPMLYFVQSTIHRGEAPPVSIEWRIIRNDARYKILDVVAEGVSMALTLRNEYSSVVKNEGVDGLIAKLREKVKTHESGSAGTTAAQ
jgi:phospholipid transport system substrate-binding protein